MTFKADSLSAEKREEDVRLTEIMQDCIGHRLERQMTSMKLLEVSDKDMASRNKVNPVEVAHRAALAPAVQNALAEPEPLAGPGAPLKIIDDDLLEEPHFPPECYYLVLGSPRSSTSKPAPPVAKSQSMGALVGPSPWLALVLNVI
ncbi:hypothetical protein FRC00_004812, partial [Tulasnella sp. 408]